MLNEQELLWGLRNYVKQNSDVEYAVEVDVLEKQEVHRWVGGQIDNNYLYAIPNHETKVLKYGIDIRKEEYIGKLTNETYKWTGGTIYDGKLYGFPRKSNNLLVVDLKKDEVREIPLNLNYGQEHHYGGICTREGIVYQPPRNSDHILCVDLKNTNCKKIYVKGLTDISRYCGSIFHPNGNVYFLPERNERVLKMDIHTEEMEFIGDPISPMCFDAKIGIDGNIYGFSAYSPGMLKIDVKRDDPQMIKEDICFGSYGTKMGVNGKLYSVPGDGEYVWEYDVLTGEAKQIYGLNDVRVAKYAGGCLTEYGDIYLSPADANAVLKYVADRTCEKIPKEIYEVFFKDCY